MAWPADQSTNHFAPLPKSLKRRVFHHWPLACPCGCHAWRWTYLGWPWPIEWVVCLFRGHDHDGFQSWRCVHCGSWSPRAKSILRSRK